VRERFSRKMPKKSKEVAEWEGDDEQPQQQQQTGKIMGYTTSDMI